MRLVFYVKYQIQHNEFGLHSEYSCDRSNIINSGSLFSQSFQMGDRRRFVYNGIRANYKIIYTLTYLLVPNI